MSDASHAGRPSARAVRRGAALYDELRARPDLLLYAIATMLLMYVWRMHEIFPVLALFRVGLVALAAALVLFLTGSTPARRVEWIRSPLLYTVLGLALVVMLSVPTSLWRGMSVTFLLKGFGPSLLLMLLLALAVRDVSDLRWLVRINLIGAGLYALFINFAFKLRADGRLGNLIFYDANDFALMVVATIPFTLYAMRPGTRLTGRLLAGATLALFVFMLMKSGSRGGFIAFVGVMIYVLFTYRVLPARARLGAVAAGILLLAVVGSEAYWQNIQTLLNPRADYNWVGKEPDGRMEIWKRGLGYMAERPVFGVGVRAFQVAEGTMSEIGREYAARGQGFKWSAAHNSFIEIGAETGVPGLILFLLLFVTALRALRRIEAGDPHTGPPTTDVAALAQMLTASLIAYAIGGLFLSAQYFSYLYVLFGMTLALIGVARRDHVALRVPESVPLERPSGWRTRAAIPRLGLRGLRPAPVSSRRHHAG